MDDDYLQPKIDHTIEDISADRRRVVFRIVPGTRFAKVTLAFEGASGIDPNVLDDIIEEQGLERQLFTDPIVVTELLERYYREQGYPRWRDRPATLRIRRHAGAGRARCARRARFTIRQVSDIGQCCHTNRCADRRAAGGRGRPVLAGGGGELARAHPRSLLAPWI